MIAWSDSWDFRWKDPRTVESVDLDFEEERGRVSIGQWLTLQTS